MDHRTADDSPTGAPYFGLGEKVAAVRGRMDSEARVVTLHGCAGVGKTTVAVQAVGADAVFSDLTECGSLVDALSELARALGGGELSPAEPADLLPVLRERGEAWIVLDGVERLVKELGQALTAWTRATRARFLVTSRRRLRVPGEVVYEVEPLALPDAGAEVDASPAVQMLVRQARLDTSGYGPAEWEALGELARQLDGIPLALRLASPRLALLGPRELTARLADRWRVLRASRPELERRQATLRSAFESSWELLDEMERAALAQLSVFRGGFTAEAAESVVEVPGDAEVLDLLQRLRESSWLRVDASTSPARLWLFQSVRDFAGEKLDDAARERIRARHAEHFVQAASQWAVGAYTWDAKEAYGRLRRERTNLFAAIEWALEEPTKKRASLAARGLSSITSELAPPAQTAALLEAALARLEGHLPAVTLARLHGALGRAQAAAGRADDARASFERALDGSRSSSDELLTATLTREHARALHRAGRTEEAREALQDAFGAHEAQDEQRELALDLLVLAELELDAGSAERAAGYASRASAALEGSGDRRNGARAQAWRAIAGAFLRPGPDAERAIRRSLRELHALDSAPLEARCHEALGDIAAWLSQPEEAAEHYGAALEVAQRAGRPRLEVAGATRLGVLALLRSDLDAAWRHLWEAQERASERMVAEADVLALWLGAVHAIEGREPEARRLLAPERAPSTESEHAATLRALLGVLLEGEREARKRLVRLEGAEQGWAHRFARRLVEERLSKRQADARTVADEDENTLVIGWRARWFRRGPEHEAELERKPILRRILWTLVETHRGETGRPVSVAELWDTAWPGETARPESIGNRVYDAVRRLRKLGLDGFLLSSREGYFLEPTVRVRQVEAEEDVDPELYEDD